MAFWCECGVPIPSGTLPFLCFCGRRWTEGQLGNTAPSGPPELRVEATRYNHWEVLHAYAPDNRHVWDAGEAKAFVDQWLKEIPRSCGCPANFHPVLNEFPPVCDAPEKFLHRSWLWHDKVSEKIGKPRISWEEAWALWWSQVEQLVTWDDLTQDTLTLAQIIHQAHPNVGGIAGCPRSGMRVASDIAIRLGVPLYEASLARGLHRCEGGVRMRDEKIHGQRRSFEGGPIVVVEDSTCSGFSILELRGHPDLKDLPAYAVYAASPGKTRIDGFARHKELPHWFEWNLWNNGQILKDFVVAIDWDGILNLDCPPEMDDDGERYRKWIDEVRPIRTPRSYQVPFIVTARREEYREQCEAWLARYGVNYGELVMFPGTFQERASVCIGGWKAKEATQRGARMFIESCPVQASIMAANYPSLRVLCPKPL